MKPSLLLLLTLAAILSACGGGDGDDPRAQVVEAAKSYQSAALEKSAEEFCELLTGKAKQEVIAIAAPLGGPTDCEGSAKRVLDVAGEDDRAKIRESRDALKPEDAEIHGDHATVRLPASGRKLQLARTGDKWLVASTDLRR